MTDAFEDRRQHVLADSLREIRRLRAELQEIQAAKSAPVAIVGMACRMPGGAEDPESFWEFVRGGGDAMREVPAGRFAGSRVPDGTWKGGFLQDIETFDAAFFGISPREAATMDPQQRLLLEVGWEALEDAGIAAERLAGTQTGVFLGVTNLDYNTRQLQEVNAEELEAHFVTSGAAPFAAGRLSYWLGLAGPSLTVDTACSSSLVGLHLGCQSLRAGDCDTALVGGVNVMLSPESFVVLAKTRALSPDGACKTFDARANGYARGEGCAIVVLKRLKDAQAAGDRILAVIKGSAVNQDGRSSGITVPNPLAQQAVVRQALTSAGVTAAEVDYVEAHGTGTPLGDPIELRALGAVYGTPERQRPLAVGSVKTNIGHLEPAAGVAGLMKVVLALGHEEIPPHQGLGEINPEIGIEDLDIVIPVKATPWSRGERTRIAGVSSFGASGTNAHVIVAEPPAEETSEDQPEQQPAERVPHILTLSAKTPASLASLAGRYAARVAAASEPEIPDICFTANTGRTAFPHRAAVVGGTPDELAARLTAIADGRTPLPGTVTGHARSGQRHDVVFLFTGQGSQYPGMGRTLRRSEPVFATAMDHCEQILTPLLGRPLREVLDPSPGDEGLIHQTRWTQPALFAIEYALAELWRSRGITPAAVMGHSVGELVAACVAGAIDLADGLLLAVRRGELMQELCEPGAMAAVFASPERVEPVLAHYAGRLALAAVNGPQSIVVSGDTSAVDESLAELAAQGVKAKRLASGLAFHSPLVEPMLSAFEEAAAAVRFAKPRIPLISNVTGQPLAEEELSARYLREHAREPVRFSDGMTWLYQNGYRTFVEIGPAPTLLGMARRFTPDADAVFLPALRPQHDDRTVLLEGLARLFVLGHRIDWASDAGRRHRVALPTYSFQRERHWYQAKPRSQQPQLALPSASQDETSVPWPGDLLGRRLSSPLPVVQYQARLDAQAQPCLGDCVLDGLTIVNIGVYLEAAFRAVRELEGGGPYVVDECLILQSLVLTDRGANDTQLHLEPGAPEGMPFRYYANHPAEDGADDWRLHARGRIHRDTPAPDMGTGHSVIEERGKALPNEMSGADFYRRMWRRKLYLGPQARWIESLRYSQTEAVARMRLPEPGETDGFLLHPGLTDSMFQLMFACIEQSYGSRDVFALVSVDRLVFHEYDTDVPLLGRVELTSEPGSATITADFRFEDELGRPVLLALGTVARKAERGSVLRTARATSQESGIAPARQAVPHAVTPSAAGNTVTSRAMGDDPEILVTARVAAALRLDPADLDRREPLQNLGMDSLMALEVRDALTADLGTSLPLTAFLDGASITTLADLLGRQTGQPASAPEPVRESGTAAEEAVLPATRHVGLPELRHDADARYEPFPMTDLQQAYWVGRSDAFALGGISTYFYTEVDLCGLDLDRLEDSLQLMIARHDMLRAVARPDGTQQVLAEVPRYVISRTDLSGVAAEERERRLAETHSEMSNQVLDATVWPAWEVRATLLGAGNVRLHVGIDALMADAWSTSLLFREWADAYADGATSKPELPVTYRDYVLAQRAMEGTEVFQRSLDYWRGRIETLPPAPDLPLARAPESIGRPEFGHRSARLSQDEWARFKQHAAAAGVTASAALCAAYSQVLAAWSRSSRFTLNVLFFNRMPLHPAVGGIVGNFTATTMLEVDSTMTDSFAARAQRSQRQLWSDMEHSHVSGVRVLRELSRARGGAVVTMPVVFASTVDFGVKENASTSGFAQHLTTMAESGREVWSSIRTPQVWLDHQAVEDNGSIVVNWDVIQGLFPAGMIDAMFEAYVGVLRGLCQDDQAWHLPVPMLVPAAQLTARAERNATESPLPDGLLHSGFAAQAARCPDRIAVIGTDRVLSYRELDAEANRVHHWLSDHGVGPGSLVGIVMEKGWQQVVAAVGILKAGAAYVPLDAALPAERLHLILASADMTVALTQRHLTERIEWPLELSVLEIDGLEAALLDEQPLPAPPCTPEDLAYVIFTSGSTGVPKGVMIEHSAAVNTVTDINERFGVTADDRILALSALNFDLSVYDIFGLLAVGGAVVLPTSGMSREPAEWARLVIEHRITIWNTVPTLMEMFTEHCLAVGATEKLPCPLRLVMMSGDWIPVTLPDRIRNFLPDAAIWSLGGATEAAIWSICYPVAKVDPSWTSIPYGYPMRNQRFHVLDEMLRPRPTWVPGQLYIAGAGLARGYLNDEAKTQAVFIQHPETGERLYRTGDLGRYLPDGTIEFLGREDSQVKVAGYRIELGDVEAALSQCPGVRAAVAAVDSTATGKRLVGYVVTDAPPETGAGSVSQRVITAARGKLPSYMVPSVVVVMDELPLTANGKVNRAALPAPDPAGTGGTSGVLPRDHVEAGLAAIWGGFFPGTDIGVADSFFDLGGDSLLAVRLMARIEQDFGRRLPVSILFARPTVGELADVLRENADPGLPGRDAVVPVRPAAAVRGDGKADGWPPLFFIHPVGGDVLCYADLAQRLGPDLPFYAIQTPDVTRPLDSVPEMAEHYAKEALAAVPDGPFMIGGWSMGGVVAIEAARQLAQLGRQPDLVIAVDLLEPPGGTDHAPLDEPELLAWFGADLAGIAGVDWRPSAELFRTAGGRAAVPELHRQLADHGILSADIDPATLNRVVERFIRNATALRNHQPQPYSGTVRLLRAADGGATEQTTRAWLGLLPGDSAAIEVPGDHYTVMREPGLAATIRRTFSRDSSS